MKQLAGLELIDTCLTVFKTSINITPTSSKYNDVECEAAVKVDLLERRSLRTDLLLEPV